MALLFDAHTPLFRKSPSPAPSSSDVETKTVLLSNKSLSPSCHALPSWLPYSTDSYFHPLVFVFVSWVGGGNPPWAVPKSLRPHCDQEKQAGDNFFAKYPCHAYRYESHAKKTAPKKVKNLLKTAVSSDWQSHPGNGEQACSLPHTDFLEFHISH